MKKSLLFGAALMMAAGAMAQLTPGEYYIKNVETGMFLNEGYSWGTHAIVKAYPAPFEVTVDGDGYLFKSHFGVGYFKPTDGVYYMDGDAKVVTYLEKAGDYYNLKVGDNYMTINEYVNYLTDPWWKAKNMCETEIYTVKQSAAPEGNKSAWQVLSRAEMIAALAEATVSNPVEASFFLNAGQIQQNADAYSQASWTYIKNGEKADIVFPWCGWFDHSEWYDRCTYAWCINDGGDGAVAGTDVVYQEVEGLPAGLYKAEYRIVNQNNTPLVVKFNSNQGKPYEYEESDLWYSSAQNSLAHNIEEAHFIVAEDGKLSVRMEKTIDPADQNRFAFQSIALYYLGTDTSSVEDIAVEEDAPVEYYNLQGVRVANPANGIFIKKQGKKASKVLMK